MTSDGLSPRRPELSPARQALLEQLKRGALAGASKTQAIPPRAADQPIALSFAQRRLWFLDQYEPDSPLYNLPEIYRLSGDLSLPALRRSLDAIVARHETLRTTFASVEGVPVPVIAERGSVFVKTIDLRDYPADERDSAALQMAIEESHRPFDLSHGSLVRAMLIQLDETEYMLLLNMHHIVSDGWSHGVFVRELAALYAAFVTNQDDPPSKLPPLPIQYTDFAVWQQQRLSGAVLVEQVNYWKQQLANIVTLDLPTDRPRPALQTHNGAVEWVTVPKALTDRLNELSRQENATLFMTLLAAYNVVLAKYSGQLDVPVGTFISNRNRAEIEGLIGFFVNTLVLRADLRGNPTLREIVQRVRKVALDAYAHQDLPFEKLLDELNPVRDTSRSPFFQTMLVLQNASTGTLELPGLVLRRVDVDSGTARFDLMLVLHETERGLEGAAEFNTDLFEARTINRLVEHLQLVLETLVRDPDRRLSDLSLLTPAEQHQLFDVWNATERPFSQATIHALFEEQAARTPDKIAVSAESGARERMSLSYRELNERANQLAHTLRGMDVRPGTLVGACLDRTPELLVGVLGILKAGAAYLPLDPDYPPSRLAFMIEDAQIALLVGHQALIDQLPEHSARTLCLDSDAMLINQAALDNPRHVTAAEDLAYVLYTSGSTGQPKGAQIPHRAVINFLESMRAQPGLTADDILLSVTSLSFDIAGLELYLPLLTGAQVALVSRNVATDGEQLRDQLAATGATVMQATPSTWRMLVHAGWKGSPSLKVLCGGEALPLDLARPLIAGNAELWNLYGPTETTIWSAVSQVDLDEDLITIGHPIANTQIYLLDPTLQPVPIGVAGELHIGGEGLSWGYLKRPALTAEKFIPDPFSKHQGARLYKTGDLAKYRHDGTIEFLGRVDFQVKVRGFRIELGEIDLALSQHPAVREAVTVARDDTGNKRLVAYIVGEQKNKGTREQTEEPRTKNQEPGCPLGAEQRTENKEQGVITSPSPAATEIEADRGSGQGERRAERDGGEGQESSHSLSSTELRNYLKGKLPEYMIPSAFVVLPAFPLTPNGKVDRKALPAPDSARPDLRAAYVAPRNEDEQQLVEIWAQVLGVEQVGVQDNFFDLGGDSLLAIRVVAKASQAGLSITTKQLFQNQTIAELVAQLGSVTIIADQGIVTGPLTWTPSERDFLLREDPHPNYYSIAFLLEAEEDLDPALVQTVLRRLMLHHDALRVRQPLGADGPTLVIDPPSDDLPFTEVDLAELSEARQGAAIKARITEIQTTFDLERGPLAKFVLFNLGPDRPNRLLLVCHYYVADLLSWQILLTDLDLAYRQLRRGEAIKLPPKTTSRAQWGRRINEHAHSAAVKDELRYWLSDARKHAALIPQDHPGGSHTIETYRPVSLYLTAEETHTLMREVKLAQGIQIDDVLLTALLLTITDWAGTRSVLVDLLGHGREALFEDMDVSRTMGWLNITYPVLLERAASSDLAPMLKAVRDQMRRIPNHGIGYSLLRYLNTDPEIAAEMAALPPVEVNFNYMGALSPGLSSFRVASAFGGHRLDLQAVRPHLLAINGTLVGDRLSMNWMYSENVHERSTVELLAKNYNATLKALVAYLHERRTQ